MQALLLDSELCQLRTKTQLGNINTFIQCQHRHLILHHIYKLLIICLRFSRKAVCQVSPVCKASLGLTASIVGFMGDFDGSCHICNGEWIGGNSIRVLKSSCQLLLRLRIMCCIKPVLAFSTEQDTIINSRCLSSKLFPKINQSLVSVMKSASCKRGIVLVVTVRPRVY
jgi:hypothetical protein